MRRIDHPTLDLLPGRTVRPPEEEPELGLAANQLHPRRRPARTARGASVVARRSA